MRKQHGFTLVELMVILGVVGITVAFGLPRISGMLENNRVAAGLNNLSAHLSYARSEAVNRSQPVMVTPLVPGNWATGWVVFVDLNNNTVVDAGEELKIVNDLNLPGTNITSLGNAVTYNQLGVATADTFTLTSPNMNRILNISPTGAVTIDNY